MHRTPADAAFSAEHTIEQVLAENLACDPAFAAWFLELAMPGLAMEVAPSGVSVEMVARLPEADVGYDIRATVDLGPIEVGLLVAVRCDHPVLAARRAREAAADMYDSGAVAASTTVWVAPEADLARHGDREAVYDATVALEAMAGELARGAAGGDELARRRAFQAGLLTRAARAVAAARQSPEEGRRDFWRPFLELVAEAAPALGVDGARAAIDPGTATLAFDAATLPRWPYMPPTRLALHLREGLASILIEDWGEDIEGLAAVMAPALDGTPYTLSAREAGRGRPPGALILADAPPLDPDAPFDAQRRAARRCIAEADALRAWFVSRRGVARYWADFVAPGAEHAPRSRVRRDLRIV